MAADSKAADKTRRERRKEARIEKNKKKFDSWIQHHQSRKLNKSSSHSKSKNVKILQKDTQNSKEREFMLNDLYDGSDSNLEQPTILVNSELKSEALEHIDSNALTVMKRKKGSTKKSKTKFGKHLEMDTGEGVLSAEEDLRLEKKLAKNLNVKDGKLRGVDDSINALLEVTPSAFDSVEKEESPGAGEVSRKSFKNDTSRTKHKKRVSLEEELKGEMTYDSFDGMLQPTAPKKTQLDSVNNSNPAASKISKRKKTKFEEYLEMNMKEGVVSVEEDFALERKLAKKLKVKKGKLRGDDDELNMLFEGIPSILEDAEGALMKSLENIPLRNKPKKKSSQQEILDAEEASVKSLENISVRNKRKKKSSQQETPDAEEALVKSPENISVSNKRKKKSSEQDLVFEMADDTVIGVSEPVRSHGAEIAIEKVLTKAPASEGKTKYVAPHLRSMRRNESEEHSQIRRRLRGLLNRLSESNVEAITGEVSTIFHSVARSVGSEIISEEVLASCSGGPRGNEQYAAVFAAFVAGMACLVGSDFSAKLLASLAKTFEDEYLKEDNLSLRNLTLLLSYLYAFGVCSSDLIYDFMIILSKRLMEVDVSIILTILQCCGMKLRSDDPAVMKNFILSVQNRVTELKASTNNDQEKMKSKRMEFMLETICDIKNNKKRPKEDTLQHTRTKKWLQKLAIENVLIRGLKWSKLLDPDKKGQWWLSGDMASTTDNIKEVARKIDWEVPETQKMLQLASAQRMNTDARRAIFCIIMSGEDYIDTFEKLLRLDLPGKQDREIMRVLVECCLQEKVFNKYYCVLASKLCSHDKNHKFTLQYCLWDHFKEVESMQLLRSMHLSKFVAEMLASFSLSLAVLKVVDLNDTTQLSPKRIMHFRMLFEAIFDFSDKLVWNMFTRIAATPEYETLRNGIEFFISKYVVSGEKSFAQKLKLAKKALNNVKGIIM